jgi:hypothetical protein
VGANATQRSRPAVDRRDDPAGLHAALTARLAAVREDVAAALAARDQATNDRARAVQALATHQRKGP